MYNISDLMDRGKLTEGGSIPAYERCRSGEVMGLYAVVLA
jgi:hypothetical protein